MKSILLFGAGKSASTLIEFLGAYCDRTGHQLIVCDQDLGVAKSKTNRFSNARAESVNVSHQEQRMTAIAQADLVISLLPASLHILVARDCVQQRKSLLTASYVDDEMRALSTAVADAGILFVAEMGLDPGIDHMSAMQIIDELKQRSAKVVSFHSHCGGLVAPGSDDNPWHYKVTWNPMNVVRAGSAGARYLKNGKEVKLDYMDVFRSERQTIGLPETGLMAWYANRDSLPYLQTYGLTEMDTFIRTTLRYPSYIKAWNLLVHLDLTNTEDGSFVEGCSSVLDWFEQKRNIYLGGQPDPVLVKRLEEESIVEQLHFLGLYEDQPLPSRTSSADVLRHLLESRLAMQAEDKDMVVMIHEVEYDTENRREKLTSSLVVKGEDSVHTAMSKTVGTPLAILATLILEEKVQLSGLHIPVIPEIYLPVLDALHHHGISFREERKEL